MKMGARIRAIRDPRATIMVVVLVLAGGMTAAPASATECMPEPEVDCAGADLRGQNFGGADLRNANLRGVNAAGVDFSDAVLTGADLTGANLRGADLVNSYLDGTRLIRARLDRAQFFGAYVERTQFRGANLTGADLAGIEGSHTRAVRDLRRAILCRTTLPDGRVSNRDC